MAITFKRIATPGRNLQHEAELATAQEDAQALADVGLGPTTTLTTPQPPQATQLVPVASCATCGIPLPDTLLQGDLSLAVKTDACLGFEPGDRIVVTNRLQRFMSRYRAGDTGEVLSCRRAGHDGKSRYTIVEVQLDKPRLPRHDKVWLHIWELDKLCQK